MTAGAAPTPPAKGDVWEVNVPDGRRRRFRVSDGKPRALIGAWARVRGRWLDNGEVMTYPLRGFKPNGIGKPVLVARKTPDLPGTGHVTKDRLKYVFREPEVRGPKTVLPRMPPDELEDLRVRARALDAKGLSVAQISDKICMSQAVVRALLGKTAA